MLRYLGLIIAFFILTRAEAQHCLVPDKTDTFDYYHFMLRAKIDEKPAKFPVAISASNYCRIWVNGEWIGYSMPQSDTLHWIVNEYDIAKELKKGINTLLVEIWNPKGITKQQLPAMLYFNAIDKQYVSWNKVENWKYICHQGAYFTHIQCDNNNSCGLFDSLTTKFVSPKFLKDSLKEGKEPLLSKSGWSFITTLSTIYPVNNDVTIGKLVYNTFINKANIEKARDFRIQITPNTKACFVFDRNSMSFGFPELCFKQGNKAKIRLSYRSYFTVDSLNNSNSYSCSDVLVSNGTIQSLMSSVPHSFRYLQLEIETYDNELVIDKIIFHPFVYPFEEVSYVKTSNDTLTRMWTDAQMRAQNASAYHFYDTLFYSDNHFYKSALSANDAILVFDDSIASRTLINKVGWTFGTDSKSVKNFLLSKASTDEVFGLDWLSLLNNDFQYRNDTAFIHTWLLLSRYILDYYVDILQTKPCLVSFQLRCALAIDQFVPLFEKYADFQYDVSRFRAFSVSIKKRIIQTCFNADKRLFSDTPSKTIYSQYTNALAILCGLVTHDKIDSLGKSIVLDTSLLQAEPQYLLFLVQALTESGNGDLFFDILKKYDHPVDSVSTNSSYYKLIPGFCSVLLKVVANVSYTKSSNRFQIEPSLGNLHKMEARIAIPNGAVYLDLMKDEKAKTLKGTINLPFKSKGVFIWKGIRYPLTESDNKIECPL
jgi:alpha-L-rhamnosidase